MAYRIDAGVLVEHGDRLAGHFVVHARQVILRETARNGVAQAYDLVAVHRVDEGGRETPVPRVDDVAFEAHLEALVRHFAVVDPYFVVARRQGQVFFTQQVGGLFVVDVGGQPQATVEGCEIDAEIELRGRLPLQVRIGDAAPYHIPVVGAGAAHLVAGADHGRPLAVVPEFLHAVAVEGLVAADALIAGGSVAQAQLQFAQPARLLEPRLVVHLPADGPRREVAPLVVFAELRRAVGAHGGRQQVFVLERVVDAPVEGEQLAQVVPVVVYLAQVGVAGVHVFVLEDVVDESAGGRVESAARVPVVGVAGHDGQGVVLVERAAECQVGLRHEVLVERIVDLGDAAVVVGVLRSVAGAVHVADRGLVTVVQLRVDRQPLDQLPVYGQRGDEVAAGGFVQHVIQNDQRVAEILRPGQIVVALLVVDGPKGVAAVFESVADVAVGDREDVVGGQFQVLVEVVGDAEVGVDALVGVFLVQSLIVVVVDVEVDRGAVVGAADGCRRAVQDGGSQAEVAPVGIGPFAVLYLKQRGIIDAADGLADVDGVESGVYLLLVGDLSHEHRVVPDVERIGELADDRLVLDRNVGLPLCGRLGRDEDHAVGAPRSVDCRCRGVLENLDRLDVRDVDLREVARIAHREAVDYDERCVGAFERAVAADADNRSRTRILRSVQHLKTCGTALKQSVDRSGGEVVERPHFDGRHRTGEVAFLYGAVADHDHLVHEFRIVFERDRVEGRRGDLLFRRFVAEHRDLQGRTLCGAEFERSVGFGGGAVGRPFDDDAGPRDGLTGRIGDFTPDVLGLGPDRSGGQEKNGSQQEPAQVGS